MAPPSYHLPTLNMGMGAPGGGDKTILGGWGKGGLKLRHPHGSQYSLLPLPLPMARETQGKALPDNSNSHIAVYLSSQVYKNPCPGWPQPCPPKVAYTFQVLGSVSRIYYPERQIRSRNARRQ